MPTRKSAPLTSAEFALALEVLEHAADFLGFTEAHALFGKLRKCLVVYALLRSFYRHWRK
jgi:hypothetical protein